MEPAKPLTQLANPNAELSVTQVFNYLKKEVKPTLPPLLPKGGDVYLFVIDDESRKSKYASYSLAANLGLSRLDLYSRCVLHHKTFFYAFSVL
jgi:hypothetical protein